MRTFRTYRDLLELRRELMMNLQSPLFEFFNQAKIKNFLQKNKVRIDVAIKTMNDLMEKYIKKDDKGTFLQVTEEGKEAEWDFKTPEDKIKYKDASDAFLAKNIEIYS